eukprot:12400956-Karenia_brevis.AAC.1
MCECVPPLDRMTAVPAHRDGRAEAEHVEALMMPLTACLDGRAEANHVEAHSMPESARHDGRAEADH